MPHLERGRRMGIGERHDPQPHWTPPQDSCRGVLVCWGRAHRGLRPAVAAEFGCWGNDRRVWAGLRVVHYHAATTTTRGSRQDVDHQRPTETKPNALSAYLRPSRNCMGCSCDALPCSAPQVAGTGLVCCRRSGCGGSGIPAGQERIEVSALWIELRQGADRQAWTVDDGYTWAGGNLGRVPALWRQFRRTLAVTDG
jgi:hypothetical protein